MTRLNKIFLFVVVLFIFFYLTAGKRIFYTNPEIARDYSYLSLFSEVAGKTKAYYLDEIEPKEKFPEAYSAMLNALHPASAYLDPVLTGNYDLCKTGEVYGVGIFGKRRHNYFYITDVLPGSPAEKAGLEIGDEIRSIQGKSIFTLTFWQMYYSLFTGEPTPFELKIMKKGTEKPSTVNLTTGALKIGSHVKDLGQGIRLIELLTLDPMAVSLLKETLSKAENPRLIIDLRRYSGGDMDSFLEITRLLFKAPKENLVLKKKEEEKNFQLGSQSPGVYDAVVIVNNSTIMYNELLAHLFKKIKPQEGSTITLVGDKTGGMISRIKQIHFEDGSSILIPEGLFEFQGKNLSNQKVIPHTTLKEKDFGNLMDICIGILTKGNNGKKEKKKI